MEPRKINKGKIIKETSSQKQKERNKEYKSYLYCRKCGAIFIDKAWKKIDKKELPKSIKKALCPACQMIQNKNYEGEIKIEFLKEIDEGLKKEMENIVKNISGKAYSYNVLSRLAEFKKFKNYWEIFTTNNQLAKRIAQKIQKSLSKKIPKKHPSINLQLNIKNVTEKIPKTKIKIVFK